ncbi:MAG TPA: hypothetical protein DCP74_13430 [Bacteroidales bacterium]|nr:hypothetical protein [Bacteroidales bacterium]
MVLRKTDTMKYTGLLVLLFFAISCQGSFSQDLEDILGALNENTPDYVHGTFKGTTIINGQSVEIPGHMDLQFNISHRFGAINQGIYTLFGIDQGTTRLGFEYGLKDIVGLAIGRSTYEKTYDAAIKVKILRQQTGLKNIPVTVSLYSTVFIKTLKWEEPDRENLFSSRLSYSAQLLIARKFNRNLSLQITPSFIHKNLVPTPEDQNNIFSVGFGGRYKLTRKFSLNGEYYWLLPGETADNYSNSLGLGFDIESAGHVFQIMATNSQMMFARGFITETEGKWSEGDIFFGFNIYRVFSTGRKNKTGRN